MRKKHTGTITFSLLATLFTSWVAFAEDPLAPAHGIHEWVAGAGIGMEDGSFDQARFQDPAGLVYDPVADRLLVADRGAGRIRTVALNKLNQVGSLGQGDGLDLSSLGLVSPTALAWLEPGVTLLVLDPGRRALSLINLKDGKVLGLLSVSSTAKTDPALESLLGHGTDIVVAPGGILISSGAKPELGLVTFTAQNLVLRRTWPVAGLTGLDALTVVNGQVLGILHNEVACAFYDVRDEVNGFPGLRFGSDDAQLPKNLTAQALNLGQLKQPWAFVKGGNPFELVTRSPYLVAKVLPRQPECLVLKLGVYDRDDRIIGVEDDQIFLQGKSLFEDPEAKGRFWLRRVAGAACDSVTRTWYMTDAGNGRILSYRPIEGTSRLFSEGNLPNFIEWNFPVARRPEVRRLAVMGLSFPMMAADTQLHSHSFSKRLEHHLNMMSSLQGQAQGYEVLFIGGTFNSDPGALSSLGQLRTKWKTVKSAIDPDELVLLISPQELCLTMFDFQMRPIFKDGLPDLNFDPEFALLPNPKKLLPEYQDICRYVKGNHSLDSVFIDKRGVLIFRDLNRASVAFNTDPYLFQHSYNLMQRYLLDLQNKTQADMQHGHRLAVTVIYYPDGNGISAEEAGFRNVSEPVALGRALRKECKALDWRFINITSEMKLFAADDPFMIAYNLHPTARGQDDLAFIAAWRLMHPQDESPPARNNGQ